MTDDHKPFPGSPEVIEARAGRLRAAAIRALALANPPEGSVGVDEFLRGLVARLGGTITIASDASLLEVDGGSLVVQPGGDVFEIRLSPVTSTLRDNFTIAHELGHLVLHYPLNTAPTAPISYNRFGTNLFEIQANRFAAAFLMPADEFRSARTELSDDKYGIAARFGVSTSAVAIRQKYI